MGRQPDVWQEHDGRLDTRPDAPASQLLRPAWLRCRIHLGGAGRVHRLQRRTEYELRLSFGDGQAARIFVDTTSYLIIGSKTSQQMMGSDIEVTTTYGEYRTFDGLRMSTEWVTDVGGMQQQKTVISDVSFRPHDAGTFDSPEWTEQNPGAAR